MVKNKNKSQWPVKLNIRISDKQSGFLGTMNKSSAIRKLINAAMKTQLVK